MLSKMATRHDREGTTFADIEGNELDLIAGWTPAAVTTVLLTGAGDTDAEAVGSHGRRGVSRRVRYAIGSAAGFPGRCAVRRPGPLGYCTLRAAGMPGPRSLLALGMALTRRAGREDRPCQAPVSSQQSSLR